MPVIMGTAGHIDHGKTTLIKALSGIDCDRLKDEKKRGITIELGFAYLDMPDGQRLGIVDVPGHEKFVKNMVAGAAGIDFVLLTVAADEGIMPQTREHLEICSLLGIREGIVAVTKTDTVDEELLELALEELRDYLSATFLKDAPIIPVSAHTGQGLDQLTKALQEKIAGLQSAESSDLFRLPVDRVFTMRGHGTVITGTLISGQVGVGDALTIYPEGTWTRVRSLQVHGHSVESAHAGQRTAVNLHGLEVEDIERGDVLARPETLFPAQIWDVEITMLPSSPKALKHRKEIHFHHGSRETLARVYLFEGEQADPGDSLLAQIHFPAPMVGVYGDRFVIRSFSPLRTIAGGKLLNPCGLKMRRSTRNLDFLQSLRNAEPREIILSQLEFAGASGLSLAKLRILCNVSSKQLSKILQDLGARQEIFLFDRENLGYVSGSYVQQATEDLLGFIEDYHQKNPMKLGVSRGMLTSNWGRKLPPKLVHFLIERCLKQGRLVAEQEALRLPEHSITLASDQTKLKDDLLQAYQQGGTQPPNLNDVLERLAVSRKEAQAVLQLLVDEGRLIKLKDGLFYSAEALETIRSLVRKHFQENSELSPTDFKELTGLSRKFSIPLLEQLDKEKLTMRVGDVRKLRKGA